MAGTKDFNENINLIKSATWLLWPSLLIILGVLVALDPIPVILLVVGVTGFVAATFLMYRYISLYQTAVVVFVFVLFAFIDSFGYYPIVNLGFKLYLADGIIFLLTVLSLKLLFNRSFSWALSSPISKLLIINFFYGFIAILIGLLAGHDVNSVIGDFRRFFFYPLAALIPLSVKYHRSNEQKFLMLFVVVLLVISGTALYRVATGQTWDPAQYSSIGDFRAIGYFTGVIVVIGLGVFYGLSLVQKGYLKWIILLFCALLIGVDFLSGFRLLWALLVTTPLLVTLITYRSTRGILKIVGTIILLVFLLLTILLVVRRLFPDWFLLLQTKFLQRVIGFNFVENVRFYAWRTALQEFFKSPIYGIGIGDEFSFWAVSPTSGALHLYELTTHNVFLSILYQTGIIGGGLFLFIHLQVIRFVWQNLKSVELKFRAPLAGLFSGYLAALVLGLFEPLFEAPGAIVALYIWIGLMLNITRYYSKEIKVMSH